jgi:hypothetical protein
MPSAYHTRPLDILSRYAESTPDSRIRAMRPVRATSMMPAQHAQQPTPSVADVPSPGKSRWVPHEAHALGACCS